MKKLLAVMACGLVVGCGDFNLFNNISNAISGNSNETYPVQTGTPYYAENKLVEGDNVLSYDTTKSFNTLIYFAQEPATNEYTKSTTYSISDSSQAVSSLNSAVSLKTVAQEKSPKELINEQNREIIEYAYNNNIQPIQKNDSALYKTMPTTITVGSKWNNAYVLTSIGTGSVVPTYKTINATCVAVSNYAYFFLDDSLTAISADKLTEITTAFDKDYEIVHQKFGTEKDIDGNGKVAFLISDFTDGILGFFYTADRYTQAGIGSSYRSNEADVLYVNYLYLQDDRWNTYKTDVLATFIHEFQHMVLFDHRYYSGLKPNIATWINEGLSMLSEYYGGYGSAHYNYVKGYLQNSQGKSLITDDSSQDYGLSYLFMRYIVERFGEGVIQKIYNSANTGIEAIVDATGVDFNTLFLDFAKMVFITGRGVSTDTKYDVAAFNCTEGTECYNQTGFNLANLIDTVYSENASNQAFITSTGYNGKNLEMYSFVINKWSTKPSTINITGTGAAGTYAAW